MQLDAYMRGLRGKRVAVLGMGVSNEPLVKRLSAEGLDVTVRDKRELPPMPGVKQITGPAYLEDITEDVVFRTPGIRPDRIALKPGAMLTSEMEAFFEVCPCPIIAVTGSDGKTTTTTLISALLKAAGKKVWLGGNIGHPLLTEAEAIQPQDYAVVELSSFQLMTLQRAPHIAVVTNVRPNHLDWHQDFSEYAAAKQRVFLAQHAGDRLVLNADDPVAASFAPLAKGVVRLFSREREPAEGCYFDGETVYINGEALLRRPDILLPGLHSVENYMAAICAVYELAGKEAIRSVAASFRGVAHRLEPVRTLDGVTYLNDSIASSPTRTIAGLRALAGESIILIAGGYDKHIPYDALGQEIAERVRTLVLTGATAPKIKAAVLAAGGAQPPMLEQPDFRDAVLAAVRAAKPGDTVLLSPASASFDQFKDFEERGNTFKKIIMGLTPDKER